jgi:antitoxin ParD1/3/4
MADVHDVSVTSSGDQIAALKSAVESGEYSTTSEIVREAIREWQLKRRLLPATPIFSKSAFT